MRLCVALHAVGKANLLGSNVTIICAPDPFVGLAVESPPPTGKPRIEN